ncbi:DNA gyrase inhibitor YacG [Andreprevotia lacus]|uniref:DNA gyrase inhibitor YacG n=1 Tax=Andreprevotia lacus TaxID=1121000 RepID=UPI000A069248|nr:DNA gyrase inhibitor YacG [Andreprevotia lacus]
MTTARQVSCPSCGQRHLYTTQNPYRPFCSERCKLIDLGAWAEERYRVPVTAPLDPDFDDLID